MLFVVAVALAAAALHAGTPRRNGSTPATGQVRLRSASDRSAFQAWFLLLADAQFYRPTPDVVDCASLVRHAAREALRPHTEEWMRLMRLPSATLAPDLAERPQFQTDTVPLFRVRRAPAQYAEFADARTIVELNATFMGRSVDAAKPGDLLYFHREGQRVPDHLMVFIGPSTLSPEGTDWLVYHTGPGTRGDGSADPGEVRKVRLTDLVRHPSPGWRPLPGNAAFVGVFRLDLLS